MTASACPKAMTYGPCGGVEADGSCELGGACVFVGERALAVPEIVAAEAPELRPAGRALLELIARRPVIVADLPAAGGDAEAQRESAAVVAGRIDLALLGDSPWDRLQLPPTVRASIVASEGVAPWVGLNCRDRNRVALESELTGLVATGFTVVHCVTGDHPALGDRPGAQAVFDLDSTELAMLAAAAGLLVSVAESPSAPPVAGRPARAAAKAAAGARLCFVNHAGSEAQLRDFIAATRVLAPELQFIVCVPLVLSRAGAERLAAFLPGAVPASLLKPLEQPRPAAAAMRSSLAQATAALAIDGVAGVDLSAVPGPGEELAVAEALAQVGAELGAGT